VAVALLMGAASAHSQLISIGNTSISLSGTVPNYYSGYLQYDGTVEGGGAGLFELNVVNNLVPPRTGTIYTFCTDVGVWWRNDTYSAVTFTGQTGVAPKWGYDTVGDGASLAIQNASWLYNKVFEANLTQFVNPDGTQTAQQVENSVAMQFAIWGALYDGKSDGSGQTTLGFGSGRFQVVGNTSFGGSGMITIADGYLTSLNAARTSGFTTYNDTWLKPNDGDSQGMLYNSLTPVPEPTTLLAGALLLLPFGASTLRLARKNRAA